VALTIVDLTDVYMTFFLSDASAGKVEMAHKRAWRSTRRPNS